MFFGSKIVHWLQSVQARLYGLSCEQVVNSAIQACTTERDKSLLRFDSPIELGKSIVSTVAG